MGFKDKAQDVKEIPALRLIASSYLSPPVTPLGAHRRKIPDLTFDSVQLFAWKIRLLLLLSLLPAQLLLSTISIPPTVTSTAITNTHPPFLLFYKLEKSQDSKGTGLL